MFRYRASQIICTYQSVYGSCVETRAGTSICGEVTQLTPSRYVLPRTPPARGSARTPPRSRSGGAAPAERDAAASVSGPPLAAATGPPSPTGSAYRTRPAGQGRTEPDRAGRAIGTGHRHHLSLPPRPSAESGRWRVPARETARETSSRAVGTASLAMAEMVRRWHSETVKRSSGASRFQPEAGCAETAQTHRYAPPGLGSAAESPADGVRHGAATGAGNHKKAVSSRRIGALR